LLNAEHSSTTSPQGTVHDEFLMSNSFVSMPSGGVQCFSPLSAIVNDHARADAAPCDRVGVRSRARSAQLRRAITRASMRLASVRSRLFAQTVAALQPLTGLSALTGPSGEPEAGSYVMARRRAISEMLIAALSRKSSTPSWPSYGFSWNGMTARAEWMRQRSRE
jgi:hypothetical protein